MKKALHGIYSNWKDLASKAKGNWKSLILVILGALGILVLALALYVFILWVLLKGLILMGLDVEESWTGIFGVSLVTIAWSILTSKDNSSSKQ
jgi:hypothetical protein